MVTNGISVLPAAKLSTNALIRFTTIVALQREQIRQVLQAHSEGSSLRGISRTSGLAYNTVVSIIRAASHRAQQVHNAAMQAVNTQEVCADELWSFVKKSRSNAYPAN